MHFGLILRRHRLDSDLHPWAVYRRFAWDRRQEFPFQIQVECSKECMCSWTWHQEWAFASRLVHKVCDSVISY